MLLMFAHAPVTLFPAGRCLHTCNVTNIAAANVGSIDDDGDEEGGKDGSSACLHSRINCVLCFTLLAVAVAAYLDSSHEEAD